MIFWHESSATEPGGTARDGRARRSDAVGITAVPVVGGIPLFGLSPAARGQRAGPHDHGADRPAVSGATVLRLAPDSGMACPASSLGQPQTRPAADAVDGAGGDPISSEHEQAGAGEQGLPVSARSAVESSRSIRSGAPASPTSRWPGAFFTWWRSWTGGAAPCWRGGCRTRSAPSFVEALEAALAQYRKPKIFNTDQSLPQRRLGVASSPAASSSVCSSTAASRSAWMAKAAAWTTSLSSGCGVASNTRKSTSTLCDSRRGEGRQGGVAHPSGGRPLHP
jgi:hypothetical protein